MRTADKIKIFLVDDDPVFTHALVYLLSENENNAEIKTFTTGEECIKFLNEYPDIVVLDYLLNDSLNGIQVLNKIKQLSPDTEVIMISGENEADLKKDTAKYGAYDFIKKGREAIYKLSGEIDDLSNKIKLTAQTEKEDWQLRWVNLGIILIVAILFILSRII